MSASHAFNQPVRRKSELYWVLPNISLTKDLEYNLVELLKNTVSPLFGEFKPFFNVDSNKINCYDQDSTMTFKCSLGVVWGSATTNRAITMDFVGINGNRLTASRNPAVGNPDIALFPTFFSIDKGGNLATNGAEIVIKALGEDVQLVSCLLIAEQVSYNPDIRPV